MIGSLLIALALILLMASSSEAQGFRHVATYRGLGGLVASAVGPGQQPGTERLYLSYLYLDHTIDVVAVDPTTGQYEVFPNPAPGESGARCMTVGPDGNVYLGTLPHAHFLKLDVKAGKLIDLGRPSQTEQYIWDVAFGHDGKLYGATYPQSKLVRYDPVSGAMEDLGRMDPVEQYAHFIAGSDDGFIYTGIGTSKANIAAYEVATGRHREILPAKVQKVGQASVYKGTDGNVYGKLGNDYFRLRGWTATPIAKNQAAPPFPSNQLKDGRTVSAAGHTIRVTTPSTGKVSEQTFGYPGNLLNVFRIGAGPEGQIYGSSILPIHFLRLNEHDGTLSDLGHLGGGEIYSFLAHDRRLLAAAYAGVAPLMDFDPAKPFQASGDEKNPALIDFENSDEGWRPQAMIEGPDGNVFIGAVSGYGKLGGPLVVWNVASAKAVQYPNLVQDQSVVTLTRWKDLIAGATTIGGGGGSHPTENEAKLFLWDPKTHRKVFETVPVAGAGTITDLIAAPNGLIYGVAGRAVAAVRVGKDATTLPKGTQSVLFAFDPVRRKVSMQKVAPFSGVVYNSVKAGSDGKVWGLASTGIFVIDPKTNDISLVASSPTHITGGFAMLGKTIYFTSEAEVWSWTK
ncbi:MAG TPA: hypothetical protein VN633_23815 [Bryobacteraceae bacterium]|nr:hypothetical protein [Bryobacteraceae bacterium]